jgi:hypothetical protein
MAVENKCTYWNTYFESYLHCSLTSQKLAISEVICNHSNTKNIYILNFLIQICEQHAVQVTFM